MADRLQHLAGQISGQPHQLPPVHLWHPPLTGDLDMRIARDGTWYHEGTAIRRQALVELFSTILRIEEDGHHYLVTPVEKYRIQVELAPFVATLMERYGNGDEQVLKFTTNVGDAVLAGREHPIRVDYPEADGAPLPLLHVRNGLQAVIARSLFFDLVALAEGQIFPDGTHLVVHSGGELFDLGLAE